ncbi:MAG: TetR/AcrR family transcriptional regulator [Rhodothermales bacterium]|nr:TetR/AcrR family transcriptional regulator [Rhodothermales bacterium]
MEQPEFKATVLDASRRLLLEQGFDHVSMRKIAAEVGCKASTLYYYFRNKEEIVEALVEEGIRLHYRISREIASKHANPMLRFEALLWTSLEFGLNNPALFEILVMAPGAGGDGPARGYPMMPGHDLAAEALRESAAQGLASVEDAGVTCAACFAMLNGVVYSLLHHRFPPGMAPDRVKRDAVKRIMSSLRGG